MPDDQDDSGLDRARDALDPHSQLRIRAAWLYFIEGLTQAEVAERLGVNRVLITRLISEARRRGEVVIRINAEIEPIARLQDRLATRFGLARAILVPVVDSGTDPTRLIAAAAGAYVSEVVADDQTIGVGWGRTLHSMLPFVEGRQLSGVRVVSLLGGIARARRFNPAEFAWRFAQLFDAEGFLIPAPALVDSVETKEALLERCGLDQILQMGESCDLALLSCGDIRSLTASYRLGHVSAFERQSLIDAGAVGDILYNFLDRRGRPVPHPVNDRAISLPPDRLRRIRTKILISGGTEKAEIMLAVIRLIGPDVVITDAATAERILALADEDAAGADG